MTEWRSGGAPLSPRPGARNGIAVYVQQLTVTEELGSASDGKEVLNADELRTAMTTAGVQGTPKLHVLKLQAHERPTGSK